MSHVPAVTLSMAASASGPERNASSPASTGTPFAALAPAPHLRSCVICRRRKVRCDKQSPCANCRRANIACVFASTDRPPKWARRLERLTKSTASEDTPDSQATDPGVAKVMERLRNLEFLVKELSGQLEQAHTAAGSAGAGSSSESPARHTEDRDAEHQQATSLTGNSSSVQNQFGRLVLQDTSRSRYVSSGFWSRVNDELDGLKMDTRGLSGDESDSSEDEASSGKSPSTQELDRAPSERHAFLFRHNLDSSFHNLGEFHPLPSQIPFLLNVFAENVNCICQIVHMPTVTKLVRDSRTSESMRLTPANEALMFSIYYAAITSMEEDDVVTNFGSSKTDLNLKFRLGLEHALAKADFLNAPEMTLVQAFAIFLCLVRRHDSPTFVWMSTGILIRMAQYLGLQRDGAHFEHMTPFEIEMRRRVWWAVVLLDARTSEDQGTDVTITSSSFDTKIPLNINDVDISPESKHMPAEHDGVTDMSFARINVGLWEITKKMIALSLKDGPAGLEEQSRLVNEIYQQHERGYLQYTTESGNIIYFVMATVARLVMAKMTLIVFLPVLFSSPNDNFSEELRTKLLVSAIEVAEYNHALNDEQACRQWRWIYQTYTHWHAIVFLLVEASRRPWSVIVERAWLALHSSWLIPARAPTDKNSRMWVPLRKLMANARKHREAELSRLRADPQAAARLYLEDQKIPLPSSNGQLPAGSNVVNVFRERWRTLVAMPGAPGDDTQTAVGSNAGFAKVSMHTAYTTPPSAGSVAAYILGDSSFNTTFGPTSLDPNGNQAAHPLDSDNTRDLESAIPMTAASELPSGQTGGLSYAPLPTPQADWSTNRTMGPGFVPWLWADTDPSVDVFSNLDMDVNMDVDGEVDWYNWVVSAKGMESQWDGARAGGNSQA